MAATASWSGTLGIDIWFENVSPFFWMLGTIVSLSARCEWLFLRAILDAAYQLVKSCRPSSRHEPLWVRPNRVALGRFAQSNAASAAFGSAVLFSKALGNWAILSVHLTCGGQWSLFRQNPMAI